MSQIAKYEASDDHGGMVKIGLPLEKQAGQGGEWQRSIGHKNKMDNDRGLGLLRRRVHLYRGTTLPKLKEFRQSYALRGLSRATNYEVSLIPHHSTKINRFRYIMARL